ncbi:unnamed protein product [marine sediment metagenome]|uniref:Uncharacterized protein n=1 Tax=marine sediment metagenome TaxID=412755 RepID=X0YSL1_9ZZZZ
MPSIDSKAIIEKDRKLNPGYLSILAEMNSFPKTEVFPKGTDKLLIDPVQYHWCCSYYEKHPEFRKRAEKFQEKVVEFIDEIHESVDNAEIKSESLVLILQRKWETRFHSIFGKVYQPKTTADS